MENNEKLLNLIKRIIKENISSKKELKKKIMSVLAQKYDSRKLDSLALELIESKTENIKDEDIDILLKSLSDLVNIDVELISTNRKELDVSDEDKILSDSYKISGLYNDSLIKIQKLENELQEKESLKKKLEQVETKLNKFENLNIEKILEENQLFTQMFKITGNSLIEVPDEDIDGLYLRYKTKGIKQYGKAFVADNETIPKTYYDLKGGK